MIGLISGGGFRSIYGMYLKRVFIKTVFLLIFNSVIQPITNPFISRIRCTISIKPKHRHDLIRID